MGSKQAASGFNDKLEHFPPPEEKVRGQKP